MGSLFVVPAEEQGLSIKRRSSVRDLEFSTRRLKELCEGTHSCCSTHRIDSSDCSTCTPAYERLLGLLVPAHAVWKDGEKVKLRFNSTKEIKANPTFLLELRPSTARPIAGLPLTNS